jgi:hypothetical protein
MKIFIFFFSKRFNKIYLFNFFTVFMINKFYTILEEKKKIKIYEVFF